MKLLNAVYIQSERKNAKGAGTGTCAPLFQPFTRHYIAVLVKSCGGSIQARWTGSVSIFSLFRAGRKCFRSPAVPPGERRQVDWSKSACNHRHCGCESLSHPTPLGLFICFYQTTSKEKFVKAVRGNPTFLPVEVWEVQLHKGYFIVSVAQRHHLQECR